jgi:hypothetical protein
VTPVCAGKLAASIPRWQMGGSVSHLIPQSLNAPPSSNVFVRGRYAGSQLPVLSRSTKAAPGCLDSERIGLLSDNSLS